MDLALYARVLWKHRLILLAGAVLGVVLAVVSYYRVEAGVPPELTPRKAEVWQSSASVLLTQRSQVVPVPGVNDPDSLARVAGLYARLATSDDVLDRVKGGSTGAGTIEAVPSVDRNSETVLPVVVLLGTAATAQEARRLVGNGLDAFLSYVEEQQRTIPVQSRVGLRILNSPQPAELMVPRKKTLPIVIFLSILVAAIGAAFVLENRARLRPDVEVAPTEERTPRAAFAKEVELRPAPTKDGAAAEPVEAEPERSAAATRRWA